MYDKKKHVSYDILLLSGSILFIVCVIVFFDSSINKAKDIIKVCLYSIVPSLFPFFIISNLLLESGVIQKASKVIGAPVKYLLKLPKQAVFPIMIGFVSGFPVGSKIVVDMYNKKMFTKTQAETVLAVCNNAGPIFIIGTIGVAFLNSKEIGLMLWFIHIISALITMFIICNLQCLQSKKKSKDIEFCSKVQVKRQSFFVLLPNAIESAVKSIVIVCAYVLFFSYISSIVLSNSFTDLSLDLLCDTLNISKSILSTILDGILELTQGTYSASLLGINIQNKILLISLFLSWAGISVQMQIKGIITGTGLSLHKYYIARCIQMVVIIILCRLNRVNSRIYKLEKELSEVFTSKFFYFTFLIAIVILLLSIYFFKKDKSI